METAGRIGWQLTADSQVFEAAFERARASADRNARGIQSALDNIKTAGERLTEQFRNFGAGLVAGLSVERIVSFSRDTLNQFADLETAARRLGFSAEQIQVYSRAAVTAGASTEDMTRGLGHFAEIIGRAMQREPQAIATLRSLNLRILDASGALRPLNTLVGEFAARLDAAKSPTERIRLEVEGLGRSGPLIGAALQTAGDGAGRFADEMRRAGLIVSNDMVAAANQTQEAWQTFLLWVQANLLPSILQVTRYIAESAAEIRSIIDWVVRNMPNFVTESGRLRNEVQALERNLALATAQLSALLASPSTSQQTADQIVILEGRVRDYTVALQRARAAQAALGVGGGAPSALDPFGLGRPFPPAAPAPGVPAGTGAGASNPAPAARGGGRGSGQLSLFEQQRAEAEQLLMTYDRAAKATADYQRQINLLDAAEQNHWLTTAQAMTIQTAVTARYRDEMIAAEGLSDVFRRSEDPLIRYNQQLEGLQRLLAAGTITQAEFARANQTMTAQLDRARLQANGLADAFDGIGKAAGGAFASIASGASSATQILGEFLRAVGQALVSAAGAQLQSAITSGLGRLFGSIAGGSVSGGGTYSSRALGGIDGWGGAVAMAGGGIVGSPHVTVFGEGQMKEAYVPLPNGNAIPVEFAGGGLGGGITINQTIDARGADAGVEVRIRQAEETAVRRALTAIVSLQDQGGAFAKKMGGRRR